MTVRSIGRIRFGTRSQRRIGGLFAVAVLMWLLGNAAQSSDSTANTGKESSPLLDNEKMAVEGSMEAFGLDAGLLAETVQSDTAEMAGTVGMDTELELRGRVEKMDAVENRRAPAKATAGKENVDNTEATHTDVSIPNIGGDAHVVVATKSSDFADFDKVPPGLDVNDLEVELMGELNEVPQPCTDVQDLAHVSGPCKDVSVAKTMTTAAVNDDLLHPSQPLGLGGDHDTVMARLNALIAKSEQEIVDSQKRMEMMQFEEDISGDSRLESHKFDPKMQLYYEHMKAQMKRDAIREVAMGGEAGQLPDRGMQKVIELDQSLSAMLAIQ